MHGFLGFIGLSRSRSEPMMRWLSAWIGLQPGKKPVEVRRQGFRAVTSVEPDSKERPFSSRDRDLVAGFNGFIAPDQFDNGGEEPRSPSQTAEALVRLYCEEGPDALAGLNGRYVCWVYDPRGQALTLANDMVGLRPTFVWQGDESFAFSSNPWSLLTNPLCGRAVRPGGLADLLLYNHHQGCDTLFEEISLLPAGSVMTARGGEVECRTVRRPAHSDAHWNWGIDRIAQSMYELLVRSMERRVAEGQRVQLPLSGGLDTRAMLGLLLERGADIQAVTQYQHGLYGLDRRYARRLARRAGVSHRTVRIPDDFLSRYRLPWVALSAGLYDLHTTRYLSLIDSMEPDLPAVSGYIGGELTGQLHVSDAAFDTAQEQFQLVFEEANRYRTPPERARELLADTGLVDDSIERYRRFFLGYEGPFSQRYNNWNLMLFQRRYTSFQPFYFEQFCPVRVPFYDADYVDFMCSVPFAALEGQRAYRRMQEVHFPSLAKVPDTNTGLPPRISTAYVLRDFLNSQYRRFVRGPLQRVLHLRRWVESQMEQYGFALCGESRPVLEHLLESRDALADYVDPDAVEREVSRVLAGDNSGVMGILGLAAFATVLQMREDPMAAVRALAQPGRFEPGRAGAMAASTLGPAGRRR